MWMNVQLVLQVAMLTPTVSTGLEATDVSVMLATPPWAAWVSQGNHLTGMCPLCILVVTIGVVLHGFV